MKTFAVLQLPGQISGFLSNAGMFRYARGLLVLDFFFFFYILECVCVFVCEYVCMYNYPFWSSVNLSFVWILNANNM